MLFYKLKKSRFTHIGNFNKNHLFLLTSHTHLDEEKILPSHVSTGHNTGNHRVKLYSGDFFFLNQSTSLNLFFKKKKIYIAMRNLPVCRSSTTCYLGWELCRGSDTCMPKSGTLTIE